MHEKTINELLERYKREPGKMISYVPGEYPMVYYVSDLADEVVRLRGQAETMQRALSRGLCALKFRSRGPGNYVVYRQTVKPQKVCNGPDWNQKLPESVVVREWRVKEIEKEMEEALAVSGYRTGGITDA